MFWGGSCLAFRALQRVFMTWHVCMSLSLFRINPENKLGNLKGVVPLGVFLTISCQRKGMEFEDLVSLCILNTQLNSSFLEGEVFTMGEWPNGSLWVRKLMSCEGQNLWIPVISFSHLTGSQNHCFPGPMQLGVRGSLGDRACTLCISSWNGPDTPRVQPTLGATQNV